MKGPDVTSMEVFSALQPDNQFSEKRFFEIRERISHVNHWLTEFGNPPDEGYFMLIVVDNAPQYWYRFVSDNVNIGRAEESDIMLNHDNVSRLHCTIQNNKHSWLITDNNSKNGLFVNGAKVSDRLLCDGDVVVVANTELIFIRNF